MATDQETKNAGSEQTWQAYRARKTEALPTTTLFGSSLEITNEKQHEQMSNTDNKSVGYGSRKGKKFFRPERIVNPESAEILNHHKQILAKQHLDAVAAKKAYEEAEQKRKNFSENIEQEQKVELQNEPETGKFTRSDLENALLMNNVGYNNGRSFNHQKYMAKAPQHQYSLIGSALQLGGELIVEPSDYKRYPNEAYITKPMGRRQRPLPSITQKENPKPSTDEFSVADLPANILHKFGTTLCKSVFSDPQKVMESMHEGRNVNQARYKTLLKPLEPVVDVKDPEIDPNYESLGLSSRQNIFPGFTYDHKISHTKSTFSPDVHKRRQPDPDQWRYQRDELTIWNEQDTQNRKLKKQWGIYEEGQPIHQPNWDRNAKRSPKLPEQPPPRPKKRQPRKQESKNNTIVESDLIFEDIEFKTPPLTPLLKAPPKNVISANATDDDFWDFYDQTLPLP